MSIPGGRAQEEVLSALIIIVVYLLFKRSDAN